MLQEVSLVAAHGMDEGAEPGSRRAGLLENALVWGKVRKANQRGTENGKKKVFWGKKNWLKERVVKADYEIVPWVTGDIVLAWWRCWGMSGKRGQVISGWWRIVRSGGGGGRLSLWLDELCGNRILRELFLHTWELINIFDRWLLISRRLNISHFSLIP